MGIVDTGLITSAVIAGGASIPAFATSAGLPVGTALGGFGKRKHDAIMLLAQNKLDSIADIISQARTTNIRRRHLPHQFSQSIAREGKISST